MARGLRIIQGGQPGGVVREAVTALLDACELLSLATSTGPTGPHIATLYFAHDAFVVWFVSAPDTEHGRQIATNPRVAAAVFVPSGFGEPQRGLQLVGTVRRARPGETAAGLAVYQSRYADFTADPAMLSDQPQQALYRFEVDAVSLVDEERFGPGLHRALVVR